MNHTAQTIVHAWMNAINARGIDDIIALYADDAVLLPTFSPHALRSAEARRTYFEQLAARPGLRVSLHERTLRIQPSGTAFAIASGIYRFELEIDDEPLAFEARFSFVVDQTVARPILHHHSSQIPRTLT